MIRKILFIPLLALFLAILFSAVSFAQTTTPSPSPKTGKNLDTRVTNLKSRGDLEITRRITSLNTLFSKINGLKKLSDAQKSTFTTNVQSEITTLTTLKSKIDADTDLATLKTDIMSIVQAYRVYLVYMPQIRILASADRMDVTADLLTTEALQLQTRITSASTGGHDVTSLNSLLTDMNSKIADAKTQYQNATNLVTSLTPAGYPGNKTSLVQGKTDIQTGAADLKTAHQDAMQIRTGLKAFSKIVSPSPSPTP